ncbi:MAG: hypothetical protein FWD58_05195 [Firmicutes bacterium]|nr:hypothetical protein [Bacillota bacterium]
MIDKKGYACEQILKTPFSEIRATQSPEILQTQFAELEAQNIRAQLPELLTRISWPHGQCRKGAISLCKCL